MNRIIWRVKELRTNAQPTNEWATCGECEHVREKKTLPLHSAVSAKFIIVYVCVREKQTVQLRIHIGSHRFCFLGGRKNSQSNISNQFSSIFSTKRFRHSQLNGFGEVCVPHSVSQIDQWTTSPKKSENEQKGNRKIFTHKNEQLDE